MNMGVEIGDVNGGYSYMNSSNGSKPKNQNSIDSKNKRDKISPNRYVMENNGLHWYYVTCIHT